MPGGAGEYIESLTKCLEFVQRNNPSRSQLNEWLRQTFSNVRSIAVVRSCIEAVEGLDFIIESTGRFSLSNTGSRFLETRDNRLVYQKLNEKHRYIDDVLHMICQEPRTAGEVHSCVGAKAGWKKTDQCRIRLNWLQSLGYVTKTGFTYHVTDMGRTVVEGTSVMEEELPDHNEIRDMIVEIGRISNVVAEKEYSLNNFRVDAAWKYAPGARAPFAVWEVVLDKNLLRNAFSNLKAASVILGRCDLFLVTTGELELKAHGLLESTFNELAHRLKIKHVNDIIDWHSASKTESEITRGMGFTRRLTLRVPPEYMKNMQPESYFLKRRRRRIPR